LQAKFLKLAKRETLYLAELNEKHNLQQVNEQEASRIVIAQKCN